jgi:DNA repair protein RecN (Recombination protein N)
MGSKTIMLSTLNIQNFAIVSKLILECPNKMSAFTGETGAGKSIMIDALGLLLGGRADGSILRPGQDKCDISAQFFFDPNSKVHDYLTEHELGAESGEVIIRRVVNKEGRSKFFINDRVSSAQQVKQLGQLLVHIHGQHEQQNLLSHQTHREHLDDFAQLSTLKQQVKKSYLCYQELLQQLQELQKLQLAPEQLQLWEYQYQELHDLAPQPGELDELYQEHHLLHHAHQYQQYAGEIHELLSENDELNVNRQLHHVLHLLSQLPKENGNIQTAKNLLDSAIIQLDEVESELKLFSQQIQINPQRLHDIDERMRAWHQLARKFQIDVHELPKHADILATQIEHFKNADGQKSILQQQIIEQKHHYQQLALELRNQRQQHAKELARAIEVVIRELGMPHAKLFISIEPLTDMHPHGMDKVEYLIATNPGLEMAPLAKIASGGELSRISLSIHIITAQRGSTPTLLFDEVDVGIGGATAAKVGQRLRELGEKLQIFCVTHQAQVAASAHQHFQVSKFTTNGETFSAILELDTQGRIDETARMLGGLTITEQARNSAKELIELAVTQSV